MEMRGGQKRGAGHAHTDCCLISKQRAHLNPTKKTKQQHPQSYRTREEMAEFRARDPVARFRQYLELQGWWSPPQEAALRRDARLEAVAALEAAAKVPKAPLASAYEDVYKEVPWHIAEQRDAALAFARATPHVMPPGVPLE